MQIEQIAKDAHHELVTKVYAGHTEPFTPWLLEFAKLVAEHEREAIIDLVAMYGGPVDLEAAIRARGEK